MPEFDQRTIVRLDGSLTISQAFSFLPAISSAVSRYRSITIDCSDAADVDVTFIQTLISARRTAEAQGKHFELTAPADGVLAATLARLGMSLSDLSNAPLSLAR